MAEPADGPDFYTVQEVAARLRVSPALIYKLTGRGELPCVRIGTAVRIARRDLETWVEARRTPRAWPLSALPVQAPSALLRVRQQFTARGVLPSNWPSRQGRT